MQYLISLIVFFHGVVYVAFPFLSRGTAVFREWKGSSVLLGGTITRETLKQIVSGLWVIAGLGLMGAGLTMALSSWAPGLWRPLAIGGALFGIASFGVFWDGQARQLANQGAIGMVISLVILAGAAAFPKAFA